MKVVTTYKSGHFARNNFGGSGKGSYGFPLPPASDAERSLLSPSSDRSVPTRRRLSSTTDQTCSEQTPPTGFRSEPFVTTQQVADHLGVSAPWVLRRWQDGELPGYRLGAGRSGAVRFRVSEVEAWIESKRRD